MDFPHNIRNADLIRTSYTLMKTYWKKIAWLVTVLVGVPFVIESFKRVDLSGFDQLTSMQQIMYLGSRWTEQGPAIIDNLWVLWIISWIWLPVGLILVSSLIMLFVYQQEKWTYTDIKSLIMDFVYKIPKLIGTNIMLFIALILLFLLLVIPGIIFSVFWVFATSIVLYYWSRGKAALKKSKQMVKGKRRKTFGALAVIVLISFFVNGIQTLIFWIWYSTLWWSPIIDIIVNGTTVIMLVYTYFYLATMFLSWKDSYVKTLEEQATDEFVVTPATKPVVSAPSAE